MKNKLFCMISIFMLMLAGNSVYAQENNSISIIKAERTENTVNLLAFANNAESMDYITLMVCGFDSDGSFDSSDIVYIDQQTFPVTDSKGRFVLSFNLGSWAEGSKDYLIRVGGSDVDEPAELVLNEDVIFYGDVDGDGQITSEDSKLIMSYVKDKNKNPLTKEQILRASVTNNDAVSAADASYVMEKANNSGFVLPAEQ